MFTAFNLTVVLGQDFCNAPDSVTLATKKKTAIHSANDYIEANTLNKEIAKRFVADSISSLIVCDNYKTFFNSKTVYCSPVRYEIGFHVLLENGSTWDTLHSNFFLPIDSSFSVLKDFLADMWHEDLLNAWQKVISNQFKVNYADVSQLIAQKRLQHYSVDFGYEDARHKHKSKIYWFISATDEGMKDTRSFLYRIDPETGAIKAIKLMPLKKLKDVS